MAHGPLSGSQAVHRLLPCALEMWCWWPGFCCQNTWCSYCVLPPRAPEKLWLSCPYVGLPHFKNNQVSAVCGAPVASVVSWETWRSCRRPGDPCCFSLSAVVKCVLITRKWLTVWTVSQEHGDIHGHDFSDAAFSLQSWALHLVCTLGML